MYMYMYMYVHTVLVDGAYHITQTCYRHASKRSVHLGQMHSRHEANTQDMFHCHKG